MRMPNFSREKVLSVKHWNESLFTFQTTRHDGLRFRNGEFVMVGLEEDNKPLMRAYSIASPNYADVLEFFSIKVANGPLTSKLQHVKKGDEVLVSSKPTGTLVLDHLLDGRNLFLLSTGTGLAPFLSLVQDPEIYTRFEKVIITHGVRYLSELAYSDFLTGGIQKNELIGDLTEDQLIYYPTVTRERFSNKGRLTELMLSGKLFADLKLPQPDKKDRFMVCGSPSMLQDICTILDKWGFEQAEKKDTTGDYVIERAFVDS